MKSGKARLVLAILLTSVIVGSPDAGLSRANEYNDDADRHASRS